MGPIAETWRTEADEEWLARHRSNRFARIRRLFGGAAGLADAISRAELGPLGGAPRKPKLKTDEAEYSVVRPVAHGIAHMTIAAATTDSQHCRRCGQTVEVHGMTQVGPDGERVNVGSIQECRHCGADSWQLRSHMPGVERFRRQARKTVL